MKTLKTKFDVSGRPISVGQVVVRPAKIGAGYGPDLEMKTVTDVDEKGVYLNGSRVPVRFCGRLAIIRG